MPAMPNRVVRVLSQVSMFSCLVILPRSAMMSGLRLAARVRLMTKLRIMPRAKTQPSHQSQRQAINKGSMGTRRMKIRS